MSVVVADGDRDRTRRTSRELSSRGLVVLSVASDAGAAEAVAVRESPDLLVVDLELPGDALAAIGRVAVRAPTTTIVAVTGSESPAEMIAVLERGASGYLPRALAGDELARTLAAAHAGEPAIGRSLVPHLIEHMRGGSRRLLELPGRTLTLTQREWDVAALVQAGLETAEIGRRLGLSPVTIRRHISTLSKKTGAAGRDELVELLDASGR